MSRFIFLFAIMMLPIAAAFADEKDQAVDGAFAYIPENPPLEQKSIREKAAAVESFALPAPEIISLERNLVTGTTAPHSRVAIYTLRESGEMEWLDTTVTDQTGFFQCETFVPDSPVILQAITKDGQKTAFTKQLSVDYKLVSFLGETQSNEIRLTWQSENDRPDAIYLIQRRTPVSHFTTVTIIENGYPSDYGFYEYTDKPPLSNIYIYRLQLLGMDGAYRNLAEITMDMNDSYSQNFQVHPSLDQKNAQIYLRLDESKEYELSVFDKNGEKVRILMHSLLEPGTHEFQWDGKDDHQKILSDGEYFIILDDGQINQCRYTLFVR